MSAAAAALVARGRLDANGAPPPRQRTRRARAARAADRARARAGAAPGAAGEDVTFTADDIRPPAAAAAPADDDDAPAPLPPPKSQAEVEADFRELLEEKGVRAPGRAPRRARRFPGPAGRRARREAGAAAAQVTPFSRWERELPKLVTDDRWRAVASMKQRRLLFDGFCKGTAEGHKRGRAGRARAPRDGFGALLDAAAAPRPPAPGAAPLRPPPVRAGRGAPAPRARLPRVLPTAQPRAPAPARACMPGRRCRPTRAAAARADEEAGSGFRGLTAETTLDALEQEYGGDPRWQARGGPAPPHAHAGNELPRGRPSGAARGQACEEDARRELLEARLAPLRLAAKQEARAALQSAEAGFRRARAPACSAGLLAHRGG